MVFAISLLAFSVLLGLHRVGDGLNDIAREMRYNRESKDPRP